MELHQKMGLELIEMVDAKGFVEALTAQVCLAEELEGADARKSVATKKTTMCY